MDINNTLSFQSFDGTEISIRIELYKGRRYGAFLNWKLIGNPNNELIVFMGSYKKCIKEGFKIFNQAVKAYNESNMTFKYKNSLIETLDVMSKKYPHIYNTISFIYKKNFRNDNYILDLYEKINHDKIDDTSCMILENFIGTYCTSNEYLIDFLKNRGDITQKKHFTQARDTIDILFKLQKNW